MGLSFNYGWIRAFVRQDLGVMIRYDGYLTAPECSFLLLQICRFTQLWTFEDTCDVGIYIDW